MDARSALFDLYGDHLRSRGSRAPVAALVRLLAPLGITAPAVRTAVSRMARQGWLEGLRLPEGAGYELTPRATRPLHAGAARGVAAPPLAISGTRQSTRRPGSARALRASSRPCSRPSGSGPSASPPATTVTPAASSPEPGTLTVCPMPTCGGWP